MGGIGATTNMRHIDLDRDGAEVYRWYSITAEELRAFCTPAIALLTGESDSELGDDYWFLHEDGHTETAPRGEMASELWPILLMTGPDPNWLLQWFFPDLDVGGDDWAKAQQQAYIDAIAATEKRWLEVCQRAIDVQLAPLIARLNELIA